MTVYTDTRYPGTRFVKSDGSIPCPDNVVGIYPEGGGPHYQVSKAIFDRYFNEASSPVWRKAWFCLEGMSPVQGYTDGTRWNGWQVPHFTRAAIDYLIEVHAEPNKDVYSWHWDAAGLVFTDLQWEEDSSVIFEPLTIVVDGRYMQVWQFADGWTWDIYTPEA